MNHERRKKRDRPSDDAPRDGGVQDVSKTLDAPRKKHGTRVTFTFTCAGCEAEATLDYKPKGVPVDELLCAECMGESENSARWKLVRDKKAMEEGRRDVEVTCGECGRKEFLSRPPKKGRMYICQRCKMEQASPDKSRLEGAARVEGTRGVMMRKSRKKPEADES